MTAGRRDKQAGTLAGGRAGGLSGRRAGQGRLLTLALALAGGVLDDVVHALAPETGEAPARVSARGLDGRAAYMYNLYIYIYIYIVYITYNIYIYIYIYIHTSMSMYMHTLT